MIRKLSAVVMGETDILTFLNQNKIHESKDRVEPTFSPTDNTIIDDINNKIDSHMLNYVTQKKGNSMTDTKKSVSIMTDGKDKRYRTCLSYTDTLKSNIINNRDKWSSKKV